MKYIQGLILSVLLLTVLTGCSEDDDPVESTFIIENNMQDVNITTFGIAPTGDAVNDVLNGTSIEYRGTYTLYGVTDCDKDIDIVWEEDANATYKETRNLPCEVTATFVVNDTTLNYSYK